LIEDRLRDAQAFQERVFRKRCSSELARGHSAAAGFLALSLPGLVSLVGLRVQWDSDFEFLFDRGFYFSLNWVPVSGHFRVSHPGVLHQITTGWVGRIRFSLLECEHS
jgi:hypothetical protein